MSDATQEIRMQVMWNRLISVVEEQALTLLRKRSQPEPRHRRGCGRRRAGG